MAIQRTHSTLIFYSMTEKQRAKLEAEAKKKLSDMRKNAAAEMKIREEKLERLRVRFELHSPAFGLNID